MLGVINTGNINAILRRNISYHMDAAGAMLQITDDPSFVVATSYGSSNQSAFHCPAYRYQVGVAVIFCECSMRDLCISCWSRILADNALSCHEALFLVN